MSEWTPERRMGFSDSNTWEVPGLQALFLLKHPVLPSQSHLLALLFFGGEVSETRDGFLQPGVFPGQHRSYRQNVPLLETPGLTA